MTIEFKFPDVGEGVAEGEIVQWLVAAGDTVEEHQSVVEVMTDKATVEIPAPADGVVTKLLAEPGETVPVGQVIFHLDSAGGEDSVVETEPDPERAAADTGAVLEFRLPDVGEGVAEGEIVRWIVDEGTQVAEHEAVVEVMTDKATVEIPAPAAGVVVKHLVAAGETVPVGAVIFHLAGASADTAPSPPEAAPTPAAPEPAATPAAAPRAPGAKVLAVPSARRVARELGVDLSLVTGSGNNGVIRRADVEAHAAGSIVASPTPAATAPPKAPAEAETRVPFRGVRRKIAEAMVRSKFTAPHFTVIEEVDATDLVRIRTQAKAIGEADGVKVTYMPFIMKAVALCLERFPMLNGRLDEANEEIIQCTYTHLGIATDTPNGLVVPVIKDVQTKSVMQLAVELNGLAERTREGKVAREELDGSTFTITNAGNIGGTLATPIINYPEVGILAVGRAKERVLTRDGTFYAGLVLPLSLSCDHRVVDGAQGARFLNTVVGLLQSPDKLLPDV